MKKLTYLFCCCFFIVLFSGCAQLMSDFIIAELEDRANEKGKQNIKAWATNNIPAGANKDDILHHLGTPNRKEMDFWIYPVPANVTRIPKGSNLFVAIFFSSDEEVITWLGYGYRTGCILDVESQSSYKDIITVGISKDALSVEKDELNYKGKNVWLLWKEATKHLMSVIVFQNEKVAIIFCFRGYNTYYGKEPVLPSELVMPE